jgi:hypothetical protein
MTPNGSVSLTRESPISCDVHPEAAQLCVSGLDIGCNITKARWFNSPSCARPDPAVAPSPRSRRRAHAQTMRSYAAKWIRPFGARSGEGLTRRYSSVLKLASLAPRVRSPSASARPISEPIPLRFAAKGHWMTRSFPGRYRSLFVIRVLVVAIVAVFGVNLGDALSPANASGARVTGRRL